MGGERMAGAVTSLLLCKRVFMKKMGQDGLGMVLALGYTMRRLKGFWTRLPDEFQKLCLKRGGPETQKQQPTNSIKRTEK